jgi:hypothetical protein
MAAISLLGISGSLRSDSYSTEVHKKFGEGRLIDQPTLDFALAAIADLQRLVRSGPTRLAA